MDFKKGDLVCLHHAYWSKGYTAVYPVLQVKGIFIVIPLMGNACIHKSCAYPASPEEIQANRRADQHGHTNHTSDLFESPEDSKRGSSHG